MRYRTLSNTGDYVFGQGSSQFLVNSPDAVGQAVKTRLALWAGEWFLNTDEGTPYLTDVIGTGTQATYDQAIQERILDTPGVAAITEYASDVKERKLTVNATIQTQYGSATITTRVI